MKYIQKAVVADGGFALVCTVVPTVGKRVFLRAVSTIPTVMHRMTPSAATVKKAAYGRSKSPAFAGTKTAADRSPSPNLLKPLPIPPQGAGVPSAAPPQPSPRGGGSLEPLPKPSPRGGSSFPLCLRLLGGAPSPWGRLGWGFCLLVLLCQRFGVDVVEHQTTDGEAEDGGDVDH